MQNPPLLICLSAFLLVLGLFCFGASIVMGATIKEMNDPYRYRNGKFALGSDDCLPMKQLGIGSDAVEYRETWWIELCPDVYASGKYFEPKYFDAICSCGKTRFATAVLMALTGFSQFVVGIVFTCLGSGPCQCSLRKAWAIVCGFAVLFFLLCLITFVIALVFRMEGTGSEEKNSTFHKNHMGNIFVALCGINMFLNLIAIIMSIVGIVRGDKNSNQTGPMRGQSQGPFKGQGQGQGQRSQSSYASKPQAPPPAYSKSQTNSQTNTSAKSKPSSQITNKR